MVGALAALAHDFYLAPSDVAVPSRAQRFHRRLLGGEARGVALVAREAARLAVLDLAGREDAGAKALAGGRPRECALDAIDFDNVDSGACDLAHRE